MGSDVIARVQVDGLLLYLHRLDQGIAGAILNGRPYEEEEREFVKRFLKPGMVFIDIGAHAGLYSCLAARQVGPAGRVFAFEPEPFNYQLLRRSLTANGFDHVRAERFAVGRRNGVARLVRDAINHGAHHLASGESAPGEKVRLIALDDYLARQSCNRVDLVKIDIEGAEPEALLGMERTIAEHGDRMALLTEFYPAFLERAGHEPEAYLDLLRSWGFRLWSPRGDEWSDAEIMEAASTTDYVNIVASRNTRPLAIDES